MFRAVPPNVKFPEQELEVIRFWNQRRIYEKSLALRKDGPRFVFYEGPPTANGMPHPGHCLTRTIKDIFPRYRTMRGYYCERKAGWDTHGLPVEVEVCKGLGIHSKEEIEAYGVEPFIQLCQQSVWQYMQEWEKLTERIGFWIKLDEAYVTYHKSFVESVWWALAELFNRGLLYQGHKIVWWWAQGGTALSAGEVGQGYREVADPSVYVKFPLLDEEGNPTATSLLVWTTTPWTLPSNQFAAVKGDLEYSVVTDPEVPGELVLASALVPVVAAKVKRELTVVRTLSGSELVGRRYQPPFDYYAKTLGNVQGTLKSGGTQHVAWRVLAADFVTTDSGTGVVHLAPAFGEVDFAALKDEQTRFADGTGPELICAVNPDGKFSDVVPEYQGQWVKDADKEISRRMRHEGTLYHQEQYLHEYPFCWRAPQDALIQYPRRSWFIRTTDFKDAMLANNREVNWYPETIKEGRFGNYLESNVDWALSRERYWGTPLPIWQCEQTGYQEAISSYAELLAKPGVTGTEAWAAAKAKRPELVDDLMIHKPYIDAVTYDSPQAAGARMRRVPEVIDCWFDSGAMPFAQWGYPHQGQEKFQQAFPADFISEAVDQTRGWFYSLLSISTMLFSEQAKQERAKATAPSLAADAPSTFPMPFKNCIVLGLMLGEDGTKLAKSKRNFKEPSEIFDTYGADAMRWYFCENQQPWAEIRYRLDAMREPVSEFLLRLWNVYSFFVIYANIDQFDPAELLTGEVDDLSPGTLSRAQNFRPVAERRELDRWMIGELDRTAKFVVERMDAYDNYNACQAIHQLVDRLSNWYVRRSRDRFWAGSDSADKLDAYWTLYECLVTTAKLIAPFTPFLAETLWQNLVAAPFGDRARESVHLADFPVAASAPVDVQLSDAVKLVVDIVSLGRSARNEAKLKVRQPLAKVEVVLADAAHRAWLESHSALIAEELNVKTVEFQDRAEEYVRYTVLPDLKKLGPKLGKKLPALKKALAAADPAKLVVAMEQAGEVTLDLEGTPCVLSREELLVRLEAKPGWAAAHSVNAVVVLATEITPTLAREGLARELIHAVQGQRKDIDCAYTDRIAIGVVTDSAELQAALTEFGDYIAAETLAKSVRLEALPDAKGESMTLAGQSLELYVKVV